MHPSSFGSADKGPGAAPAASRTRIQRSTAGRRLAGSPPEGPAGTRPAPSGNSCDRWALFSEVPDPRRLAPESLSCLDGAFPRFRRGLMARVTVEDCIETVPNRFHRVQRVTIRTKQAQKGRQTSGRRPDQHGGRGGPAGDRGGLRHARRPGRGERDPFPRGIRHRRFAFDGLSPIGSNFHGRN